MNTYKLHLSDFMNAIISHVKYETSNSNDIWDWATNQNVKQT